MNGDWLTPAIAELDRAGEPVTFFFRDDDAGWDDAALLRLLDLFESHDAPIDVAAIPAALGHGIVGELARRIQRHAIGVHQHGWAHTDHQLAGRSCEFGSDREEALQLADIAAGQTRLREVFGAVEPTFTPPWNRCTTDTGACLTALGFTVLSRDISAPPLDRRGLTELPVSVDWCGRRRGVRFGLGDVGEIIAERIATGSPVGVMLHHAASDAADLNAIAQLLTMLRTHQRARLAQMRDVAG